MGKFYCLLLVLFTTTATSKRIEYTPIPAPDFSSSLQLYQQSSQQLERSMGGLADSLSKYVEAKAKEEREAQANSHDYKVVQSSEQIEQEKWERERAISEAVRARLEAQERERRISVDVAVMRERSSTIKAGSQEYYDMIVDGIRRTGGTVERKNDVIYIVQADGTRLFCSKFISIASCSSKIP